MVKHHMPQAEISMFQRIQSGTPACNPLNWSNFSYIPPKGFVGDLFECCWFSTHTILGWESTSLIWLWLALALHSLGQLLCCVNEPVCVRCTDQKVTCMLNSQRMIGCQIDIIDKQKESAPEVKSHISSSSDWSWVLGSCWPLRIFVHNQESQVIISNSFHVF